MDSSLNMELSVFVARVLGVMYLSVGLGLFLFREAYILVLRKLLDSLAYAMFGGFIAIIGGMALVSYHNIWVNDWRIIITLIGWVALINGILIMVTPTYLKVFKSMLKVRMGIGLTLAIFMFGAFFFYFGFIHQ